MSEFEAPPVDIPAEVKKAVGFLLDKTYEPADMVSHMLSLIKQNSSDGSRHKDQLERMIFKYQEMRRLGGLIKGGHKQHNSKYVKLRKELDEKAKALLTMGYNIDRFKEQDVKQKRFFNG